jgi:hypothetical protein
MRTSRANFPCDVELPERYEAVRWIADGGMASVWCVHDHVLGRRVAIKLLAERFAHNDDAIRRFTREARTAARLSGHPHVVSIHDIGMAAVTGEEGGERPFIVMEYLAGGTVADAVRHKEVDRGLVLRWLGETASALDFAHAKGVVHRDIKPGNLLLDREQLLYVADFGIARLCTEETITQADQVLGTAAYISPEQALGGAGGAVSDASDRYSLAIVAYELLVGQRPFTAEPLMAQARQHIEQDPPRASRHNPLLPRAIDGVLAKGMAKRPEERFETATAFIAALRHAGADRPAMVVVTPRRRVAVLGSLAAAAFVVGVAAGAASDPGTSPAQVSAHVTAPAHHRKARHHPAPARRKLQSTTTAAPAAAVTSTTPTTTGTAQSADALLLQTRQLMVAGNPAAAIPLLRQVMAISAPGSPSYLEAARELMLALREAAQPQPQTGGASPTAPPPGKFKHGKGPDGKGPPGHDH